MKGNTKGSQFNDRLLAGQVRNLALKHLHKVLDPKYEDKEFQKQVLLKIASSLLPRLNEHTGEDGAAIPITLVDYANYKPVPTKELSNSAD